MKPPPNLRFICAHLWLKSPRLCVSAVKTSDFGVWSLEFTLDPDVLAPRRQTVDSRLDARQRRGLDVVRAGDVEQNGLHNFRGGGGNRIHAPDSAPEPSEI